MLLSELLTELHRLKDAVGDDCRLEVSIPIDVRDRVLGGPVKTIVPLEAIIVNGSIVDLPYAEFVGRDERED